MIETVPAPFSVAVTVVADPPIVLPLMICVSVLHAVFVDCDNVIVGLLLHGET